MEKSRAKTQIKGILWNLTGEAARYKKAIEKEEVKNTETSPYHEFYMYLSGIKCRVEMLEKYLELDG